MISRFRNPYRELERSLGYAFRRRPNLESALTHRSFRYESKGAITTDNQRLEYLGDAALSLVVAERLYEKHPDLDEGALTRLRSRLTSTRALADLGRQLKLGDFLRLGRGERQSGGGERDSTLEDALEAVLGAAYVDGGLRAVRKIFDRLFAPLAETLRAEPDHVSNPKGALQELCQRLWKRSPAYQTTSQEGPSHDRRFTVVVSLGERVLAEAVAPNQRAAQAAAAVNALRLLQVEQTEESRDD